MWSEWLTRTLRPRPAGAAAKRAPEPAAVSANDEHGMDAVRPSTRELALAAEDEEAPRFASAEATHPFSSS